MSARVDMRPSAVSTRLRYVSELSADLAPERRLQAKLDMRAAAVSARLRECAALLEICQRLAQARPR
jgi:hypothetical protein